MNGRGTLWRLQVLLTCLVASLLGPVTATMAHEIRPAYLQLDEIGPGRFQLIWRTPVLAGMRLPVVVRLPDDVRDVTQPATQEFSDSLVVRQIFDAGPTGLAGRRIEFVGLQATVTNVLVRVQMLDGTSSTSLVRPSDPWVDIVTRQGRLSVIGAYVSEGIEHILLGFDHLLFVLALILIVPNRRVLLWTITAFTLAHSITLSLATLGVVHVPGPPVEATIALSIILLACEVVRLRRGERSLTARWPWIVAFSFGLLHGFGFAGALTEIGLPQGDIPLALFSFNIGVEVGQLVFIGAVLAVMAAARRVKVAPIVEQYALSATTYGIGIMAAFWFIQRLAAILA